MGFVLRILYAHIPGLMPGVCGVRVKGLKEATSSRMTGLDPGEQVLRL